MSKPVISRPDQLPYNLLKATRDSGANLVTYTDTSGNGMTVQEKIDALSTLVASLSNQTAGVSSVNKETGDVTITASNIGADASGAAAAAQAAAIAASLSATDMTVTKQGNAFNGVSQLVQLGTDGKLTALDGSNLTNLPSGGITALTSDVTASGTGSVSATIAAGAVTLAKQANLAANSIIGNNTGSPATPLALTVAQIKTLLAISASDVGAIPATAGAVTLSELANIAAGTILGNNGGSPGAPIALTAAQLKTLIAIAQADISGLTTGSSPTFVGETLSGMTTAGFVKNNGSGVLSGGNSLAMSDLPADAVAMAVSFVFTNGGSALVTGIPPGFFPQFRIAANLMGWELTASGSGSAVLDILSANNAIPTASNSMATGNSHTGTPPTLASVQLAGGTSFTNWYKTAIAVNDFLGFNLLSVSSGITALTLTLFLQAT